MCLSHKVNQLKCDRKCEDVKGTQGHSMTPSRFCVYPSSAYTWNVSHNLRDDLVQLLSDSLPSGVLLLREKLMNSQGPGVCELLLLVQRTLKNDKQEKLASPGTNNHRLPWLPPHGVRSHITFKKILPHAPADTDV